MKKLLVLILALVMIMSLTACGGNNKEVEITIDNWEEYFTLELKAGVLAHPKAGGTALPDRQYYIVLKDGVELDLEKQPNLVFQFSYDESKLFFTEENGTYTEGNLVFVESKNGSKDYYYDGEKFLLCMSSGNGSEAGERFAWVPTDLTITNVKGTIYLK